MTITALIKRLEEEKRKYGDIEAVLDGKPILDIATFTEVLPDFSKGARQVYISAHPAD